MRDGRTAAGTARRLLQALWLGALPSLLAVVSVVWLVPKAADVGVGSPLRALVRLFQDGPALAVAATFIVYAVLARAWCPAALRPVPAVAEAPGVRGSKRRMASLAVAALLAAAAALVLRGSVAEASRVMSPSMLPTLLPGDRLWVDKLAFGFRLPLSHVAFGARPPRRGDLVVFRGPGGAGDAAGGTLVKRVIGLPGDHITMVDHRPFINGQPVLRCDAGPFVYFKDDQLTRARLVVESIDGHTYLTAQEMKARPFPGYVVKPGEVFVLGDNRAGSVDSRSWNNGSGAGVPFGAIEGKATRVIYGTDHRGDLDRDRLWRTLDADIHVPGFDTSDLRRNVDVCVGKAQAGT